nr:hypothetical protein [Anaerobacillus isosaccharinicus]
MSSQSKNTVLHTVVFCGTIAGTLTSTKLHCVFAEKPGEIMEVDWAGSTSFIIDRDTGEKVKAYIFVATLPCSQFSYAEASLSMDSQSWINAHNSAYKYFEDLHKLLYRIT